MQEYPLHFNGKFQAGLLVLLLTDYEFFRSVIDDLSPKHLDAGESYIKLLKLIKKQWDLSKKPLSIEIVKNTINKLQENKLLSDGDVHGLTTLIDVGKNLLPQEYEYIKENVFEFLKKQVVTLAFSEALESFEKADYDTMYGIITKAVKKSFEVGNTLGVNWLEYPIETLYSEPPRENIWSSGFPKLDGFLEGGGFASSEAYTIISATGRGKTACLCNLAVTATKAKKKSIFITLEMSQKQIQRRYDSVISGFSAHELSTSKEAQIELFKVKQEYAFSLPIIKEFSRGTLSINGLHNYLERFTMEYGKPDVIIVDWVGCMKMPQGNGENKRHEQLAEVADELVNISRQYKSTVITAHQTNRSAIANEFFNYSAISESYASLFGMDVVLGLGATDKSKDAGRRTLNILKNRFGPDSVYVPLIGDLPGQPLTFRFREVEDDASLME